MLHLMLVAALAAAPDATPEPVKLASPELNAVNVDPKLAGFFAEHFARELSQQGLRVFTAKDISALIGVEHSQELKGCSDAAQSCMAELANALGVDGLIVGNLALFGGVYQVDLKVVSSSDAAPIASFSGRAEGDKAMLAELTRAAKRVAPLVLKRFGRTAPAVSDAERELSASTSGDGGRKWPLAPTIVAGVLIGAGGFFTASAANDNAQIFNDRTPLAEARARAADVQWKGFAATGCFIGGAAALVTAGVLYGTSGGASPATVALSAGPDGAGLVISGALP